MAQDKAAAQKHILKLNYVCGDVTEMMCLHFVEMENHIKNVHKEVLNTAELKCVYGRKKYTIQTLKVLIMGP